MVNSIHREKFGTQFHHITEEHLADYWVLDTLGDISQGTFIEAGGSWPSTCLNLEKYWGWRGHVFEPNNKNYQEIISLRDSKIHNLCLWRDNNGVNFCEPVEGHSCDSYVEECITPNMRWNPDKVGEVETVFKNSMSLNSVFEHAGWQHCNFISLDIEGAEADVIEQFDHTAYSVDCWQLEGGHRLYDMMQHKGYCLVQQPFAQSKSPSHFKNPNSRDTYDKFYISKQLADNYKYRVFDNLADYYAWSESE